MWNPADKGVDQMASSMDLTPEQNQLLRTRLEALLTSMDQNEKIKPRPARKKPKPIRATDSNTAGRFPGPENIIRKTM